VPRSALIAAALVLTALTATQSSHAERRRACPATAPNGNVPAGAPQGFYGNGRLATTAYGVIVADKRTLNPDGSVSEKFPWWGSPSLSGDLRITGKRLDKVIKRRVTANIQGGGVSNAPPGSHFWSTGITFPTTGCWRIEGRVGTVALFLVVIVRRPPVTYFPNPSY
jgi:hypothetical protein